MNSELAAAIILFGSFLGMGVIISRKIPVLVELQEVPARVNWKDTLSKLKEKIKILNPFKSFSYEIFLQKLLSKIRILSLKTDNKTFNWLQKLREKSQKKKNLENDNYWQELKKSTTELLSIKARGKKRANSSSPKK